MLTYPTGSTARRARKHGHRGGEDVSSSAISSEGTVDANGCVKLEEKMGTKIAKASKEIGVRSRSTILDFVYWKSERWYFMTPGTHHPRLFRVL